jgi:Rieske 2Fe-2S family protein
VELARPGSYLAVDAGGGPVLIVRDRAGEIRAFHNSCRHRGSQVCPTGRGKANRLVCPYHQWTYDLDGSLAHAGRMPETFDPSQHGLAPVRIETIAGSLYVCMSEDAPDFEPFRRALTPQLTPHNLQDAKVAYECELVEQANWKLVMENARECYHCPVRHPELSVVFPMVSNDHFAFDEQGAFEAFSRRMAEVGVSCESTAGPWWGIDRFPLKEGATSLTLDGAPVTAKTLCSLAGGDVGTMRWALEANGFAHALGDFVFSFIVRPVGPQETVVQAKWLVHKDAQEGVDYSVDHLIGLWDATNRQDRDLAENNQRGVNSPGYRPGPYSEEAEAHVLDFVNWYCDMARSHLDPRGLAQSRPVAAPIQARA